MKNIFDLPEFLNRGEVLEPLARGETMRIEKIISRGDVSPEGYLYDQAEDEWVLLLSGEAVLEFFGENVQIVTLKAGDYLMIPAHRKHRVSKTSSEPPCVWLCVFGKFHKDTEK